MEDVNQKLNHPERFCQICQGKNVTWYADNNLFNKVNGSPNGIICPACFQEKADKLGLNIIYKGIEVAEKTLDEIGLKYGTDKASNGHNYCLVYERYLEPVRNKKVSVIEIGVGGYEFDDRGGESLKTWYDYFPNGRIVGVDLFNKINIINDRTEFWQGSQIDKNLFESILLRQNDSEVRIVVDDASHAASLTIKSLEIIFPLLTKGDLYIIEDTHVSYFKDSEYEGNEQPNHSGTIMRYVSDITPQLCEDTLLPQYRNKLFDVEFIHFYRNLIILKKR